MFDEPGTDPQHSPAFRRGGRAGVFSFEVKGPRHAAVVWAVDHRDLGDTNWSNAGEFSMLAPEESAFLVSGLKDELRIRCSVVGGVGADPVEVRALPPEWLPY